MLTEKRILVIGRHANLMSCILEMLRLDGYDAVGKQENEEAIAAFEYEKFDVVVIGGGVDSESRKLFKETFICINPSIRIIDAHPKYYIIYAQHLLTISMYTDYEWPVVENIFQPKLHTEHCGNLG